MVGKFTITLSSGTVIDPNAGYVGINEKLDVCQGYDSGILPRVREEWMDDNDGPFLTPAEQIELAETMIGRWQRFADRARLVLEGGIK